MSTLLVGFDSAWTATNPQRKRTFSQSDWEHVCRLARSAFSELGLVGLAEWIDREAQNKSPRKSDQDCLDACVCLLVALQFAEGKDCLKVGNHQTGYIVVPDSVGLRSELEARCNRTCRLPSEWIRVFRLEGRTPGALHLNAPPNIALEPSAP